MHLLWPVPGGLSGRRHRRRPEFRIRHRDARRALLRQGAPAFERRPLGARSRQEHRARRAIPVSLMVERLHIRRFLNGAWRALPAPSPLEGEGWGGGYLRPQKLWVPPSLFLPFKGGGNVAAPPRQTCKAARA